MLKVTCKGDTSFHVLSALTYMCLTLQSPSQLSADPILPTGRLQVVGWEWLFMDIRQPIFATKSNEQISA